MTELTISSDLISQYFGLETPEVGSSYEQILGKLTRQIQFLLNNDFQALLNALYRIDVDERKFMLAIEDGTPDQVANNIAKLILDRIIIKAQTRLKYRQDS